MVLCLHLPQICPYAYTTHTPHILAGLHHLSSILVYSSGDLVRRTGLSRPDVHSLLLVASKALLSTPLTLTLASFPGCVGGEKTSSLLPCGLGTRLRTPRPLGSNNSYVDIRQEVLTLSMGNGHACVALALITHRPTSCWTK